MHLLQSLVRLPSQIRRNAALERCNVYHTELRYPTRYGFSYSITSLRKADDRHFSEDWVSSLPDAGDELKHVILAIVHRRIPGLIRPDRRERPLERPGNAAAEKVRSVRHSGSAQTDIPDRRRRNQPIAASKSPLRNGPYQGETAKTNGTPSERNPIDKRPSRPIAKATIPAITRPVPSRIIDSLPFSIYSSRHHKNLTPPLGRPARRDRECARFDSTTTRAGQDCCSALVQFTYSTRSIVFDRQAVLSQAVFVVFYDSAATGG